MNDSPKNGTNESKMYYKCSACGVIHESVDGAPKYCVKCDNDKFYKVMK